MWEEAEASNLQAKKRRLEAEDDENRLHLIQHLEAEETRRHNLIVFKVEKELEKTLLPAKMNAYQVRAHAELLQGLEYTFLQRDRSKHNICYGDIREHYFLELEDLKVLTYTNVPNIHSQLFPPMKLYSAHVCRLLGEFKWCGMLKEAKIIRDHSF